MAIQEKSVSIRNMEERDVDKIRNLINNCKPLDLHTPFTYWVLAKYFGNCCYVLEEDGEIVAFASAVKSTERPEVMFFWQIAIQENKRGKNYSALLIDKVLENAKQLQCKVIQVSIAPGNKASYHAFASYCTRKGLPMRKADSLTIQDTVSGIIEFEHIYDIIMDVEDNATLENTRPVT